jgi:hypothetical protein
MKYGDVPSSEEVQMIATPDKKLLTSGGGFCEESQDNLAREAYRRQ